MEQNPEQIQSKQEYGALEALLHSEGFTIYSRLLTTEMNTEYNAMMKHKHADDIKSSRDRLLGLKDALEIGKSMLQTYKGKYNE